MIQSKKNILEQINIQELLQCNSQQSQSFGRRLYKLQVEGRRYWLKLHVKDHHLECENSFIHELKQYAFLLKLKPEVLLPFEIVNPQAELGLDDSYMPTGLLVQDSESLFKQDPQKITRSECIKILSLSLDALEQLHRIDYLHGDLKTEHFRNYQGKAVLIDFEQAGLVSDVVKLKNTATPRYMAPELFHGKCKTKQTDIYALGIIWLEWLNQVKTQQFSYLAWAKWHCQQLEVDLVADFADLKDVLHLMLAKNSRSRCSNIYQIKQLLSKYV